MEWKSLNGQKLFFKKQSRLMTWKYGENIV